METGCREMAEAVDYSYLLRKIEVLERDLEELKALVLRLQAEKEEPEVIPEEEYQELVEKAEHLKKHPEEGLTAEEAVKLLE